jgi:hypothetical protein
MFKTYLLSYKVQQYQALCGPTTYELLLKRVILGISFEFKKVFTIEPWHDFKKTVDKWDKMIENRIAIKGGYFR